MEILKSKKMFSLAFLMLGVLILSGCGVSNQISKVPTFKLSQSIWKSTDGGASWELKNKGEGKANAENVDVLSFAINPFDGDNVYVGLRKGGILETKDGGETWKFINNYTSIKVYGLALSPADGKTLYASGVWNNTGKIFKTEDDGENWTELYTSPSVGPIVASLTIDPKNPNVIYAGTDKNEAIKSTDGGATWKNIYLANNPVMNFVIDSADSNLIYFIDYAGQVFRSEDGGNNVEDISNKISDSLKSFGRGEFKIIRTDPNRAGHVYLAGADGIMMSADKGETWTEILALNNPENFPIRALAINPKNSDEMVYAMDQATYKSVDGGKTWKTFQFDNKMKANVLEYSLAKEGELYIGFTK